MRLCRTVPPRHLSFDHPVRLSIGEKDTRREITGGEACLAAGETDYFACDGQDDALLKVAFPGSQVGKGGLPPLFSMHQDVIPSERAGASPPSQPVIP